MINRLAVIISGELRTWRYCSKYLFRFFENRAKQIDYFFVTWNVSLGQPVSLSDITDYFYENNLVNYKILESIKETHTYVRQNWMAKNGNMMKKEQELNGDFIYDQVVHVRPDIYYKKNHEDWVLCEDFRYTISDMHQDAEPYLFQINDVYIRTNSFTDDIFCQRIFTNFTELEKYMFRFPDYNCFYNHHYILASWIKKHNLISQNQLNSKHCRDFLYHIPLRSYHNFTNFDQINLDNLTLNQLNEFFPYGPPDKS
jgi:hypothetical protein